MEYLVKNNIKNMKKTLYIVIINFKQNKIKCVLIYRQLFDENNKIFVYFFVFPIDKQENECYFRFVVMLNNKLYKLV